MGMLEDDLQQFPPGAERPRKVHLHHDNGGATYGPHNRPFADTLCKMNSTSSEMQISTDPNRVTCKICRRDHRFRALVAARAGVPRSTGIVMPRREPELVSHFRIEIGDDYVEHRFGTPAPLARVRELATHFVNAMTSELP